MCFFVVLLFAGRLHFLYHFRIFIIIFYIGALYKNMILNVHLVAKLSPCLDYFIIYFKYVDFAINSNVVCNSICSI